MTGESGTNQYYDDGSTVGTFKSVIGKVHPNSKADLMDTATIDTAATTNSSTASTLTRSDNWEEDFQMKMKLDPGFKKYILETVLKHTQDGPPKPPAEIGAAAIASGEGE